MNTSTQQELADLLPDGFHWGDSLTVDDLREILAAQALAAIADVEPVIDVRLDELAAEVARLQDALAFWLPSVPTEPGPIYDRIANDVYLLNGCDGNLPDRRSAQELGWITVVTESAQFEVDDARRLDFLITHGAWVAWSNDHEKCRVFHNNDNGESMPMLGWVNEAWHYTTIAAIDAAIAMKDAK